LKGARELLTREEARRIVANIAKRAHRRGHQAGA
jgi:hypothetical protein